MTKNDVAWEILFENHNILGEIDENGRYVISSEEIKKVREPRLMAKFDYENQLPHIFSKNKLAILPISRGSYLISNFKAYHNLEEKTKETHYFQFPDFIESLDFNNITSESQAINCAYITGILTDFLEDDNLCPTVHGRMGSGQFDFNILNSSKSTKLDVSINNSQIEIDGAYEGFEFLSLIESKIEYPENFLVRQLYYPFRTWNDSVNKQIKNIFLVYSNGIFSLYEYVFTDEYCYNSLKLVKKQNYSLIDGEIDIDDILEIASSIKIIKEPKIPFPQADKFERIISLCEVLKEKLLTIEDITVEHSFDSRQSYYYTTAGRYLGLIKKTVENGKISFSLSYKGKKIFNLPLKQRQLELVKCILEHNVFLTVLELWLNQGEKPSTDERVQIMKEKKIYGVKSDVTFKRRSRTVGSWLDWILELKNDTIIE